MSGDKKPWIEHPEIWKSQSSFMSYIRGGIRRGLWNEYRIKLDFIKNNRKKIKNPNPRGRVAKVWGGTCYFCGNDFIQKELQIDHKEGNHSLKSMDDVKGFIEGLLFISEDDLDFTCKPCHDIKSYADRNDITFEQAKIKKKVIAFSKDPLTTQLKTLKSLGIVPKKETKKACKEAYSDYLENEEKQL